MSVKVQHYHKTEVLLYSLSQLSSLFWCGKWLVTKENGKENVGKTDTYCISKTSCSTSRFIVMFS